MRGYPEAHRILQRISIEHDLPVPDFCNGRRTRTVVKIRNQAIRELREATDLSWAEINKLTGRKGQHRVPAQD